MSLSLWGRKELEPFGFSMISDLLDSYTEDVFRPQKSVSMVETPNDVKYKIVAPGVDPKNISVVVKNGVIEVTVKKEAKKEEKEVKIPINS